MGLPDRSVLGRLGRYGIVQVVAADTALGARGHAANLLHQQSYLPAITIGFRFSRRGKFRRIWAVFAHKSAGAARAARARNSPNAVLPSEIVPSRARAHASSRSIQWTSINSAASWANLPESRFCARNKCTVSENTPGELRYGPNERQLCALVPVSSVNSRRAVSRGGSRGSSLPAGNSQSQPPAA